ncbi:site-specific integrase [Baia soyae]|uniref:Site-specific recombinase XerD n=1 Tax=Baia soyae TaxID=1544746 RepID=A0A4R2RGN0_9BACL|nr:site-specific integrase [Baia soyae]TCP61247.1 site-specific recombinase XerD [Baia soyae]
MRGHVTKKGNKFYFVLDVGVDEVTGKRKQKWFSGFKDPKEAEKAMIAKIHELNQGIYYEPTKFTLADFMERWLEDYVTFNCAPRTREIYEYIIHTHISRSRMAKLPLDKIKPIQIQNYYSEKLTKGRVDGKGGLTARSVLHHHRILHEALEHAVKWQILGKNPTKAVTPPRLQKKEVNVLSKDQIQILLEGTKNKYFHGAVFFAISTGMRRGEIFGLRWSDVDFKNQTLSIRQTLQRLKGKGLVFKKSAKNDGSRRSVAISSEIIKLLQVLKATQEECKQNLGVYYQDHDLVFSNEDGTPINVDYVSREFGRSVKKLDIPYVRFHDLRHTHATLLLQQGEHPKIISERLGHSTISITMDIYSHVMPNMQREATDKLDRFLFSDNSDI